MTAMFPFTKVYPDYARLQETYERFHAANPDITVTSAWAIAVVARLIAVASRSDDALRAKLFFVQFI
ncbi:hypothetical protein AB9F35_34825, partial [Rhizobium leguminosarum]|uniref:hypothetical protein n=1 Tax=Rhizobium leguminosarum TaxID=384 RepID=UPI003F9A5511